MNKFHKRQEVKNGFFTVIDFVKILIPNILLNNNVEYIQQIKTFLVKIENNNNKNKD